MEFKRKMFLKVELMIVAMPSASKEKIKICRIIKILPSIEEFSKQLKDIGVEGIQNLLLKNLLKIKRCWRK